MLLTFDEVMTGFRVALGGAQELYGVDPDLTTLGKVIGGGLPVGAYAGKREIMETVAPAGPMYQAGTLSGNPLAMTAGLVTLKELRKPDLFDAIVAQTERLCQGVGQAAKEVGVPVYQTQVGSMFCTFFTKEPVTDYASAKSSVPQPLADSSRQCSTLASTWPHRSLRPALPAQPTLPA